MITYNPSAETGVDRLDYIQHYSATNIGMVTRLVYCVENRCQAYVPGWHCSLLESHQGPHRGHVDHNIADHGRGNTVTWNNDDS